MNIGKAAAKSGLPAKTIRYYEQVGLICPSRIKNGYRDYNENDLHTLRFLQRCRSLGFSVGDCRQLLSLYADRQRASLDVKVVAEEHLSRIEAKITELQGLKTTLQELVNSCHGDERPDCPILDDLSANERSE